VCHRVLATQALPVVTIHRLQLGGRIEQVGQDRDDRTGLLGAFVIALEPRVSLGSEGLDPVDQPLADRQLVDVGDQELDDVSVGETTKAQGGRHSVGTPVERARSTKDMLTDCLLADS
jgi:hypothetical protein